MKLNKISIVLIVIISGCSAAGSSPLALTTEKTRGFIDEINRSPEPYDGPVRTGKEVYAYRCMACHARATQGAPLLGDTIEWNIRARQGMHVLMSHVLKGFNRGLMPPKGGCGNCSDPELHSAVKYMLKESGVEITR